MKDPKLDVQLLACSRCGARCDSNNQRTCKCLEQWYQEVVFFNAYAIAVMLMIGIVVLSLLSK